MPYVTVGGGELGVDPPVLRRPRLGTAGRADRRVVGGVTDTLSFTRESAAPDRSYLE